MQAHLSIDAQHGNLYLRTWDYLKGGRRLRDSGCRVQVLEFGWWCQPHRMTLKFLPVKICGGVGGVVQQGP